MTPSAEPRRAAGELTFCAAAFMCALILRAVHLYTIRDAPLFRHLFLDPLLYDEWGRRIAAGAWLGGRAFFQDPGYAYVLGAIYAVVGHSHLAVAALQSILGALIGPLLYFPVRREFGTPAAVATTVLGACYLPAIYYDGVILKTSSATFLVALALCLVARALERGRPAAWLPVGSCVGMAVLFRGNLLAWLPVLAAWLVLDPSATAGHAGAAPRSRRLAAAAFLVLGASPLIGLTSVHNRLASGEWIATTSNAGQNFYIGNNPWNETGRYRAPPFVDPDPKQEESDFAAEATRRAGRALGPREISRFWMREGLDWIASRPGDASSLLVRKIRNLWGGFEIPDNLDIYMYREWAPVLRLPLPGFWLVAPFALAGMLLALRRPGWPRALLLFVAVYALTTVAFFVLSRFRMSMMPALFVFAGHGLVETARAVTVLRAGPAADRARAGARLGLLLVLVALVNLPVRVPRHTTLYRVAERLGLPLQAESSAIGRLNLGLAYAIEAGRAERPAELLGLAEQQIRDSLREDAASPRAWIELGKVLARMERNGEAIRAYLEALALEPRHAKARASVGVLYQREGDLARAEEAFRIAADLDPSSALVRTLLGEVLLAGGRAGAAAASFRAALEIDPDSARARRGLEACAAVDAPGEPE